MGYVSVLSSRIKAGAKTVDFNEIVDFDWDRACIITPYMSLDEIEAMLGFEYPDYIANSEEKLGIVFLQEKIIINSIKIDRYKVVDYFKDNNTEHFCLTKNRSVMDVTDKHGRPALKPIQN